MSFMVSKATSITQYLDELPEDRKSAIGAVRDEINRNLPDGYEEGIQYGMIGWYVPHSIYPNGYHCDKKQPVPFVSLASQRNHMAIYLFCLNCDPATKAQFIEEYLATGKKLDTGSSCVRFKKLEDLPLKLVGKFVANISVEVFLKNYEEGVVNAKKK
jgi:uncharacterized protein YdhG (YjbR/CyaY superfamily)